MKNKISCCIVALALVFSGCSENLPDMAEVEKGDEAGFFQQVRFNNSECEYTVYYADVPAYIVIGGKVAGVTRLKLVDDYENSIYAYCANLNAYCYEEAEYKCASADDYFQNGEDTKIMAALSYIMNRYGEMETTNPTGFRQMIQGVIWSLIHGYTVTYVENTEGELIKDVVNYICDNIDDILNDYKGISMKGVNTATENGLLMNYGPYKVSENAFLNDVDFQLTFIRNDVDAIFVNDSGEEITLVKIEEPFYLQVPNEVWGDIEFTATASNVEEIWYINDYKFLIDVREDDYQQLFHPIMSLDSWDFFHSCSGSLSIASTETETIMLTELSWNNGNGGGINRFTVDGITLKNSKNYVTPANFDVLITKKPGKNDETAIYTVTERIVAKDNGTYLKEYGIKVALYIDGRWKGYSGVITVNNPGGNDANQQVELERIF